MKKLIAKKLRSVADRLHSEPREIVTAPHHQFQQYALLELGCTMQVDQEMLRQEYQRTKPSKAINTYDQAIDVCRSRVRYDIETSILALIRRDGLVEFEEGLSEGQITISGRLKIYKKKQQ